MQSQSPFGKELSRKECLTLLRLDGTLNQSQEGWEFDYKKIDAALTFLKISYPVRLGFKAGIRLYGDHQSINNIHEIKISTYMEIDDANETLWHELAHASQAEELYREIGLPISDFYKAYNLGMGPTGSKYRNNLFEIQARAVAEKYGKLALLC